MSGKAKLNNANSANISLSTNAKKSDGNNYHINNNYFSSTVNNNSSCVSNYMTNNIYPSNITISTRSKPNSSQNNLEGGIASYNDNSKLISDMIKNINKYSEKEKKHNKLASVMNLMMIIIAIILVLVTIILHSYSVPNAPNMFAKQNNKH